MDILITDLLMNLLMISITLSIVIMALIQKIKTLPIIKKGWHVWILNLLLSFAIGIPFAIWFYKLDLYDAIWVGAFSFIGAPSIYEVLKKQNIINYTPKPLEDIVSIPKENEIKRD